MNFEAMIISWCNFLFEGMDKVEDQRFHRLFWAGQFGSFMRPLLWAGTARAYLK